MAAADGAKSIWLNDARAPEDRMSFRVVEDGYSVEPTVGGGVETGYGSGRSRGWSTEDDQTVVQVRFLSTSPEQRAWLLAHRGRTVCFRDHLGLMVFGQYQSSPLAVSILPPDHPGALNAVALSLTSVSFSVEV